MKQSIITPLLLILLSIPTISRERTEGTFSPKLVSIGQEQLVQRVNHLIQSISFTDQRSLLEILNRMDTISSEPFSGTPLLRGDTALPVVVFIQGLPPKKKEFRNFEWVHTMYNMMHLPHTTYFLTISRKKYLEENGSLLFEEITTLKQNHPGQELYVFAHCTGGSALISGLHAVSPTSLAPKTSQGDSLHFITMGSPMNNYNAPRILKGVQALIPASRLVLDLGITGLTSTVLPEEVSGTHYVTNYAYDHTNTNIAGRYLQLRTEERVDTFARALQTASMPFGSSSLVFIDKESHFSIIEKVLFLQLGIIDYARRITGSLVRVQYNRDNKDLSTEGPLVFN